MPYHTVLTVDVEDWFQVENLKVAIPFESWPNRELRVERNTHKLLDLFDEISDQRSAVSGRTLEVNNKSSESCKSCLKGFVDNDDGPRTMDHGQHEKVRSTFFVLGWLAERLPNLVREIHSRGHEVASHGYHHDLCSRISRLELRRDLLDSKKLLEDTIGSPVHGYRAPSFSISDDILQLIAETGYQYDSSYNSFTMHGRYGKISLNGNRRSGIAYEIFEGFYELAISNLPFSSFPIIGTLGHFRHFRRFSFPWGGGAYFRLIPGPVFRYGVNAILRQQQAYLFYMHPWEVDPDQPRPAGITLSLRFKHYTNLDKTEGKLKRLLLELDECSFVTCHEHLERYGLE